jgi:uncharacterized protein (DUF697 family)/predicted GTPase
VTDDADSERTFLDKYEEEAAKIGRFNLAIFGKTGTGKSTLINAVFGEDVAPTGIGEPVTRANHLYLHRAGFFGLIDTRGLEIGTGTDQIIAELGDYLTEMRTKPLAEQVHVAWYCVRASDRRFEDTEAEFIRRLHSLDLPVVVVLTQVPSRDGLFHEDAHALADHIASLDLPIYSGRPLLVMAKGDDFTQQAEHGLKDLLDATFRVAPEGVTNALNAAQKIDVARKWKSAQKAIAVATTGAGVVGAIPIPVADAILLVPTQLALMAKISAIYGIPKETAGMSAVVATSVATAAGRGAVTGLLKLIPGAGWVIGGAISAATAASLTAAMGYAWATVCGQLSQGKLAGADGALDRKAMKKLFENEILSWVKKLGSKKDSAAIETPTS